MITGISLLFTDIPEQTMHFLAGALIGIGAAAAIGELAWTFERRELRDRNAELRQPILSQCRIAYRIGEFFFPCYAVWSKGQIDDRHVTEFLDRGEPLGIRKTLEALVAVDANTCPDPHEYFEEKTNIALGFLGQHVVRFFRLGDHLTTLRSAVSETSSTGIATRNIVITETTNDIRNVTGFLPDAALPKAWLNFTTLWGKGCLVDQDVDALLLLIHSYFLSLGISESEFDVRAELVDLLVPRSRHPVTAEKCRDVAGRVRAL